MSLNLVNNNYVGEIIGALATLLTLGASDLSFFNVKETKKGKKARFAYATVETVIQTFDSICDVVDDGDVSREMIDIDLVKFVVSKKLCYDINFDTDYADATDGYESQTLGDQIVEWARMEIDNFSFGLQSVRWCGDTGIGSGILSKYDGVVLQLQGLGAYVVVTNETGYHKAPTVVVTSSNALQQIGIVTDFMPHLFVKNANKGYKILVSQNVANLLITQVRNNDNTTGLTSLPKISLNAETGQLTDGAHFGAPVYVAFGLDAVAANQNVIMAGIFTDSPFGILKFGVNKVMENETLNIREVDDGDAVRMRAISSENVAIVPDGSQMAMNI